MVFRHRCSCGLRRASSNTGLGRRGIVIGIVRDGDNSADITSGGGAEHDQGTSRSTSTRDPGYSSLDISLPTGLQRSYNTGDQVPGIYDADRHEGEEAFRLGTARRVVFNRSIKDYI